MRTFNKKKEIEMPKETIETKVLENDYNGKPMFSIYEIDEEGNKAGYQERPVVNRGIRKAKYLLDHIEDLKEFVTENS